MPEKTQVDDRFIRMHPELFQKQIILAAIKSYQFYRKMRGKLCPYEESRKSRRPDFQGLEYNRIFGMVADFWDSHEPMLVQTQDYFMRYPDLEEILRSEIEHNRMTQPDAAALGKMIEEDMELYEFSPEVLSRLDRHPMLNVWLSKRAATNLIEFSFNQRMIKPMSIADLKIMVAAAEATMTDSSSRLVRGADLMFGLSSGAIPFDTDIEGVNRMTGGGLRARTTTLVAGINGGGKTILAMQWAKHFALRGANVVVFTTEQPPEQLITRMICNHLQVGFERFTQTASTTDEISMRDRRSSLQQFTLIPEDVLSENYDKIVDFYQKIHPRLYFVDWSEAPMAVYKDFDAELAAIEATGWDPDVVIFDWIGGGIDNVRGTGNGKQLDIRILYKEAIETIIAHGKRTRRVMIAMAQLNKTNVGPKKKAVMMADLAECKSMTDNVAQFIGISALRQNSDSTDVGDAAKPTLLLRQYLNLDKARFGPGGLVPVDANFRIQAFRGAGGMKRL